MSNLRTELDTTKADRDALQQKVDQQLAEEIAGLRKQIQTASNEATLLRGSLEREREKAAKAASSAPANPDALVSDILPGSATSLIWPHFVGCFTQGEYRTLRSKEVT
jgi:molecular chaperone GrpE (heat shock protein)